MDETEMTAEEFDALAAKGEPVVVAPWRPGHNMDRAIRMLRPGITVCIAAHPARLTNGMLARALASVLRQTHQPVAILVNNDVERVGAGGSRQRLLDLVETEWIAWIDSDDEWKPEHLEKLWAVKKSDPDIVYVYSWFEGNDPLGHFGKPFNPCFPHHTTSVCLERADIAKRAGFKGLTAEEWPVSNEDWYHIARFSNICCEEGLKMVHLAEKTWTYNQTGQNSSGQPGKGDATLS